MNANTACKIRKAVEQAVRCGETRFEIEDVFRTALLRAFEEFYFENLREMRTARARARL